MALEIIIAVCLFFGIIFTALPTIPGMGYMFVLTLVYGFFDGFETFDPWWFAFFGGLGVLGIVTDYLSGLLGAKMGGANKKSVLFGLIGLVVGLVLFPPFGLFIGLFLGVLIGELVQKKNTDAALKAASYSFVGTLAGIGFNVALAITFFVAYLILVF